MLASRSSVALTAFSCLCSFALVGCTEGLPDDIRGYRDRCISMTPEPIPPSDDDPHAGTKRVWACNVTEADLLDGSGNPKFPYPDGTLIVKESQKQGQDHVWLIATARKEAGSWTWNEYTRNFENELFAHILADESVCTGCHKDAKGTDWIWTVFTTTP